MKYIKSIIVCLLFISIISLPTNTLHASDQDATDIENYIYETYGSSGQITINQEHMEAVRNAPKEGGVYPVEITVEENGMIATTILYITVKPAVDTTTPTDPVDPTGPETKPEEVMTGPSVEEQAITPEEELDVEEGNIILNPFSDDEKIIRTEGHRKFSIVMYLSFFFAIFLILMLITMYYLFGRLKTEVNKEINKLNTA